MHYKLILFSILFTNIAFSQNLVPNPSFEDTVLCPDAENQIERAIGWINYGETPDYFNSCSQNYSVPYNPRGYEPSHSGNAYAGLITYWPNDYREYIAIQLNSALIIGERYYISLYASQQELFGDIIASNKIGIRFTMNQNYTSINSFPTDNFAHVYTDSILTNTNGWYKLSGTFIADSAYTILVIGNFFDNLNTDTICSNQFAIAAEYYVDDVCVSTDSVNCNFNTSIQVITEPLIQIYYNNASNLINVINKNNVSMDISIYDISGKILFFCTDFDFEHFHSDLSYLSGGNYFISVITNEGVIVKQIIKI